MYTFSNIYIEKYQKAKKYFKHIEPHQMEIFFYIAFIHHNSQNIYFLKSIFVMCHGK